MKNTGGAAFPQPICLDSNQRVIAGNDFSENYEGMTLRDYFASKDCIVYKDVKPETAAKIMGIDLPCSIEYGSEFFEFWLKWEAFRRYSFADAMIAERNKGK